MRETNIISTASDKTDHSDLINAPKRGKIDVWALGITIVIGGQYFSWNAGLVAGFGSYCIGTVIIGFAYLCLCLCTAELSSTLPFAGGAYGLARCTLGFYAGFIIGCCEAVEYIIYVAASVLSLGSIISSIAPVLVDYQPLLWLMFYVTANPFHIFGGHNFWRLNLIVGVVSLFIIILYCVGSLPYANFDRYAVTGDGTWFVGGLESFLHVFPLAAWFFVGVEALNMACDDIDEPKKSIPYGQISCIVTLFVTALSVLFISSSLPPGIDDLSEDLAPLNKGMVAAISLRLSMCVTCYDVR